MEKEKGKKFYLPSRFLPAPNPKGSDRMSPHQAPRPAFGQPGWRRRMEDRYGWDKEFAAVGAILLLLLLTIGFVRADDQAGPQDPKEMAPAPQQQPDLRCYTEQAFLPMPEWSHFTKMPPLPEALTPMGAVANKARPSPAAVAETRPDMPPMPKKLPQIGPLATSGKAAPSPSNKPTLEAISPFLQWIQEHPQQAAAAARKDAATENAAPASDGGPGGADPYWMPPMMDEPVQAGGNGSTATYSTPQK
jgi:hypothetical protein